MKWTTIEPTLAGINKMISKKTVILISVCTVLNLHPKLVEKKQSGQILGYTTKASEADKPKRTEHAILAYTQKVETKTAFDQKTITETRTVPYETQFTTNKNEEYGTEKVVQEGKNGTIKQDYLLTYWGSIEIDKQLTNTEKTEPTDQIIEKGTKITWKLYETPDVGGVKYWHKMRVWATKYDANCSGCTGRTFSGTEVVKGVCATDPKVIPLGTNFYVDGYGLCRAEDVGGAIKGNKIDLGYKDAKKGDWTTRYTDIYLLTNEPR